MEYNFAPHIKGDTFKGWQCTIKDADTGVLYRIESNGTSWYYTVMIKAL
jgi:hypothetical protein